MTHAPLYWHYVVGFVTGGGLVRLLAYISKAVPPLPNSAGWWSQFGYQLLKGASGLDPNATNLKPFNGVDRRQAQS